jgi:acyl-CoA oxidase
LSANYLSMGIGFSHAGISAEGIRIKLTTGDNAVLIQKVAKELLAGIQKKSIKYPAGLSWNGQSNRAGLLELMTVREQILGRLVASSVQKGMQAGKPLFQIWMGEISDDIQSLGKSFGERVCASAFFNVQKSATGNTLGEVYELYCLSSIFNNLASYQMLKILNVEQSQKVIEMFHAKVKIVAGFSLQLVDYIGLDPGMIRAPIAGDWETYSMVEWG